MTEPSKPGMTRTALVVTTLVIVAGIYDLVVVARSGTEASVSRFLQDTAFGSPLVTFTFGFIAGHLFGYLRPTVMPRHPENKP